MINAPHILTAFLAIGVLSGTSNGRSPEAVAHGSKLSQFFRAAASTPVDVIGIGDSNQIHLGNGWDHGWILALDGRLGTYATSLHSLGESNGNGAGAGVGFRMQATASQGFFDYSGAQAPANEFLTPDIGMRPLSYVTVPDGQATTLLNHGIALPADGLIPTTEPLRVEITYATHASHPSDGFRPSVRIGQSPYTVVAQSPLVPLVGGPAMNSTTLEYIGAPSPLPLQFMLGNYNSQLMGPFVGYTMRVVRAEAQAGAAFSTLYYFGNQTARDMAAAITEASDTYIREYFRAVRESQGDEKFVLVRINTGVNDRNEPDPPVDGSDVPPNSPEAYAANLATIIDRIAGVWADSGWDPRGLYFLITPTHPIDGPDDEQLVAFRVAAADLAASRPRVAVMDLSLITNEQELLQNSWYRLGGFDRNHLTEEAYEALSLRELDALLAYTKCPDINGDGLTDLADLNAVLASFGQASSANDLTGDGIVGLQDLNALLSAFGSPCSLSNHD